MSAKFFALVARRSFSPGELLHTFSNVLNNESYILHFKSEFSTRQPTIPTCGNLSRWFANSPNALATISVSGFKKRRYSQLARPTARLFALLKPEFSSFWIKMTLGNYFSISSSHPSNDPWSTTIVSKTNVIHVFVDRIEASPQISNGSPVDNYY